MIYLIARLSLTKVILSTFLQIDRYRLIIKSGIAHLVHIPWLASLNLKGCHKLSNKSLRAIGKLQTLTTLDLSLVPRLSGEGLSALSGMSLLEDLRLTGCRLVKADDIASLVLPSLRVLDIRATGVELTRAELLNIFPTLKSLAIAGDTNLVVAL